MYTEQEAIQYIKENDVRFIKLFFTDIYGAIKSISIQPSELERAFVQGIPIEAGAMDGLMNFRKSDLFIVPDASTLSVLPWRPQSGRAIRFFCNIRYEDGTPFEGDTRYLLGTLVDKAIESGYEFTIGTKCEFYLFKCDERGVPVLIPHDDAGLCDLAPRDKGENVRREICLTLEQMGVHPESSHHEAGPGQNEVDFTSSYVLNAMDNMQTFKVVVKTIAARNGLFACFLPKPISDKPGNGLHFNISFMKNEENQLANNVMTDEAKSFISGILNRMLEITAFLNPIPNSYVRLGNFGAPKYVSWGCQNWNQLIRIPFSKADGARIEIRSPDSACNPYLSAFLILSAGLEGISKKSVLPAATDFDLYNADPDEIKNLAKLPTSLDESLKYALKGDFIKTVLPKMLVDFLSGREFLTKDFEFGEL